MIIKQFLPPEEEQYFENPNTYENGEEYLSLLQMEVNRNFPILQSLLSSYYRSPVDGPLYARFLKAIAIELSRIRLNLSNVFNDADYSSTRGEFVNQILGSIVFPDGRPDLNYTDVEFRDFYQNLIRIYFKGSIPESISKAVSLITKSDVVVRSSIDENRIINSTLDISDQFNFTIDVMVDLNKEHDITLTDPAIRMVLGIIRPAHTLYTIRYILKDQYIGNQSNATPSAYVPHKVLDSYSLDMDDYSYADHRKFWSGVLGVDDLGMKESKSVMNEDHSDHF